MRPRLAKQAAARKGMKEIVRAGPDDEDIEHAMRHALAIDDQEDAAQVAAAPAGRLTMAKKTHGRTGSGKPITDQLVKELADKAEAGYDVDETIRRRSGRPPTGSAAASAGTRRGRPARSR
jgi:hypothetical protein